MHVAFATKPVTKKRDDIRKIVPATRNERDASRTERVLVPGEPCPLCGKKWKKAQSDAERSAAYRKRRERERKREL